MTTTDEFIHQDKPRWVGSSCEPRDYNDEDCDCIVGPDEEAWLRLHMQHRNNLRLVVAGALGFALALALGLSAAWQIDRWAADWHYDAPDSYVLPDHSAEHMAYRAPGDAA